MYEVLTKKLESGLESVGDNTHIVYLTIDGVNVKAELCEEHQIEIVEERFRSEIE